MLLLLNAAPPRRENIVPRLSVPRHPVRLDDSWLWLILLAYMEVDA